MKIQGERIPGSVNSLCKGPEAARTSLSQRRRPVWLAAQARRKAACHKGGRGWQGQAGQERSLGFLPEGARGLGAKHGCNLSRAGLCAY